MKPESRSTTILAMTRSKAKMYEYNVPEQYHITLSEDPAKLFSLAIGILGDVSAEVCRASIPISDVPEAVGALRFSAHFFDSYLASRLNESIDSYLLLLASAAYYLCDLPGSSRVLVNRLPPDVFDPSIDCLEHFLHQLLVGITTRPIEAQCAAFNEYLNNLSNALQRFWQLGEDDDVVEPLGAIERYAYSSGVPRDLLLADAICAVTKKRISISAWKCVPQFSGLPVSSWEQAITKWVSRKSMVELWPAQRLLGQNGVFSGTSAVVQMPTSAGKTRATEIIIRSAFLSNRSSLAVVVAPFRALCHEIHDGLKRQFAGESVEVDELSDVIQNDFDLQDMLAHRQILVVTPEKLNYVLRQHSQLAEKIKLIIYDEGHLFDDESRGVSYELLLSSLKARLPVDAQSVLISAVISNASDINDWLLRGEGTVVSGANLTPMYRTVAFASWVDSLGRLEFMDPADLSSEAEFYVPRVILPQVLHLKPKERKSRVFPERGSGTDVALYLALTLSRNGCVAIFTGRKDSASKMCEDIVDRYERNLPIDPPSSFSDKAEVAALHSIHQANFGAETPATIAASLGVFMHHGNTPQGIRLAVEYALKQGLAKCVVCTSTLAQGVNLPLRYLIVSSVRQGYDRIKTRDFHNLIGRAGRSGMHTEGSIIFSDPKIFDGKNLMSEKWRWQEAVDLLNPENSELCSSHLLTLFQPLRSDDKQVHVKLDPLVLIRKYVEDPQYVMRLPELVAEMHADKGFTLQGLRRQISSKLSTIASIESYLMANLQDGLAEGQATADDVGSLVEETLAFFLAEDEQKDMLKEAFSVLAKNLLTTEPDNTKRMAFSKTLLGITQCRDIEKWLWENMESVVGSSEQDLLPLLWPLLNAHIRNTTFRSCGSEDALRSIAQQWIMGEPFNVLFDFLGGIRIGTRLPKMQHIVDICENGLGFDGSLVIGAVAQMLEQAGVEQSADVLQFLAVFQKRLKYGLQTSTEIALYELGFADRPIARALAQVLPDFADSRKSAIAGLRSHQREVWELLSHYPSYFKNRLSTLSY